MENIDREVLLEVIGKLQLEENDILLVRAKDEATLELFCDLMNETLELGFSVLVVDERHIEYLRDMDEETMKEFGWRRI